jgi:hypothetical protein
MCNIMDRQKSSSLLPPLEARPPPTAPRASTRVATEASPLHARGLEARAARDMSSSSSSSITLEAGLAGAAEEEEEEEEELGAAFEECLCSPCSAADADTA